MIPEFSEKTRGLFEASLVDGYTGRAVKSTGARAVVPVYPEGSRGDFLQALQVLGTGGSIRRLLPGWRLARNVKVHLSCSRDVWTDVFGQPECVETCEVSCFRMPLHVWQHACSDGPVACMGHLFERSPDDFRIVLVRISLL